jgi:hypothetical protein
MAYKQKGFSPFTASEEELERRRKKKLKEQQQLQDKIDKFNQQDPYSVDYGTDIEKVSEQIKGYVPSNKPGSKKSTIISTRQLTKTTPTETGFDVSKSDDFLVRERKKDFKKARFKKKDRTYTPTRGRGVAIAKTFQGKRPVDETDQGRIFYDRGDKGAEGRFASSEVARIGKRFKPKQKYGIIQKAAGKLFKRSKVKGLTLPEVEAGGKKFKESYMQSGGKRRTTKKTRREKGSLNIIRDKVKRSKSKKYDFGNIPDIEGKPTDKKYSFGYVRKTGEGFLGLQNRKTYVDGKLYTKPKSKLFSKTKIKPPKQNKVKTTKSDKPLANMEAITVTPKMQSRRDRKATRASNKANRQQKRADRKKKLLAAANMKSMRNFDEKFN